MITKGSKGSTAMLGSKIINKNAKQVNVKSTVGAGDAYSAGIISGIVKSNKAFKSLTANDWKIILEEATEISATVCSLNQNYINNND